MREYFNNRAQIEHRFRFTHIKRYLLNASQVYRRELFGVEINLVLEEI